MPVKRDESEDPEGLSTDTEPDDLEEAEEDEEIDEADEEEVALPVEEKDGPDAASLDELLAKRAASRRAGDDSDDDDDIMPLSSERNKKVSASARVIPIKDREEFVCTKCRLVKAKTQLADAQRGLCRDCV